MCVCVYLLQLKKGETTKNIEYYHARIVYFQFLPCSIQIFFKSYFSLL